MTITTAGSTPTTHGKLLVDDPATGHIVGTIATTTPRQLDTQTIHPLCQRSNALLEVGVQEWFGQVHDSIS